jgi:hypothetical protein
MEGALSRLRKNAMLLDQPRVGLWYRRYENSNVDPARGMFVSIKECRLLADSVEKVFFG